MPDWNSIAGMLGPFTRRFKNHCGVVLPPWKERTDSDDRDHLMMPADIASVLRDEAGIQIDELTSNRCEPPRGVPAPPDRR